MLDEYMPKTLLNTELNILAKIPTECLQPVVEILLEPEQACAVNSRTIPINLHLIRTVLDCRRRG